MLSPASSQCLKCIVLIGCYCKVSWVDIIYLFMLFLYSEQKCLRSQKYASENGLPIMKNVLLPKSKGFCACLEELRDSIDAGTYLHYLLCTCYWG